MKASALISVITSPFLLSLRGAKRQSNLIQLIFIFVLYGCETPIDPKYYPDEAYDPEPNVFCVISAGLDVQKALVGKTYKVSDTIPEAGEYEWAGVSGARVTIAGAGDTIKFDETDSAGIYVGAGFILPCTAYHLEVIYPDNKKVSGDTKTPGEFELLKPQHSDTVTENDTLFWSKSIDADIYYVMAYAWSPWDTAWMPCGVGWASDTFIRCNEFIYFGDSLIDTLMIKVAAYDKNYHDYDWYGGVEYTNLDGGVGVFGSITITDSILIFVK